MTFIIREAHESDALALATVGVDTWRAAYRGIVDDAYLDSLSHEKSEQHWHRILAGTGCFTLVAEDESGLVAGFALSGAERDGDPVYEGELYALYVLKEHQGRGIGRALVKAVADRFRRDGIASMVIWVISANPSRGFYERLGGRVLGTKVIEIGGRQLEETAYGWDNLLV